MKKNLWKYEKNTWQHPCGYAMLTIVDDESTVSQSEWHTTCTLTIRRDRSERQKCLVSQADVVSTIYTAWSPRSETWNTLGTTCYFVETPLVDLSQMLLGSQSDERQYPQGRKVVKCKNGQSVRDEERGRMSHYSHSYLGKCESVQTKHLDTPICLCTKHMVFSTACVYWIGKSKHNSK